MYTYNTKKNDVIKFYSWICYDISLCGLMVYNFIVLQIQSFTATLDSIEKAILTLCTAIFGIYRIYILHLDAEKKKMENQERRDEIKRKKLV